MKIVTATQDYFDYVAGLFKSHDVSIFRNEDSLEGAEMLVFTGGEDVNPALYSYSPELQPLAESIHYNKSRDERESEAWKAAMNKNTPFIFGICRGLQFINVMLGGSLILDIASRYGTHHRNIHEILSSGRSHFKSLTHVNSLHHQGLLEYGVRSPRTYYETTVMAVEPNTNVVEVMKWTPVDGESSKILGVQFHPEFFGEDTEHKKIFLKGMSNWINRG